MLYAKIIFYGTCLRQLFCVQNMFFDVIPSSTTVT